jgi:hypothetical protein
MIDRRQVPAEASPEQRKLQQWGRTAASARELANRVASSSEETAALFDSGYRPQSELGIDPRDEVT